MVTGRFKNAGDSVTILATPNDGYGFIAWNGTGPAGYTGYSNPVWTGESTIDVSTGDGSGATLNYGAGPPDYWNERRGTIATSPSVTLGTSPVMEVYRPESASRVASVCFMGMLVAWTPAAVAANPLPLRVYPQILAH